MRLQIIMRCDMISVKENAYAKINLYLDVLSKREDGFHEVKTIMHTVSLADELTVSVRRSERSSIRLTVVGQSKLPTDSRNLAVKAAELFLTTTLINAEVNIKLVKKIPVAAGLAGGSTDAAAVLRALNRAFKKPLTEKRLLSLAAELGSDVPYCLLGGTALCYGRGERIERLPEKLNLHIVIASTDEYVSTPFAYSELDRIYSDFTVARTDDAAFCYEAIYGSILAGRLTDTSLYNVFEKAILPNYNGAEYLKSRISSLGATHALMSGSGPSVYGIFTDKVAAESARDILICEGVRAYYAETV